MRPNAEQLADAIDRLTTIPMFPVTPAAHREVMRVLFRMIGTVQQLDWLVTTMVDNSDQWHGAAEMRGVFCTQFTPADGVEKNAQFTTGFKPADIEAEHLEANPYQKRIEESPIEKVFSPRREERIAEMGNFLKLLQDRKKTAPHRLGSDAPRAIKQIEKMSMMVSAELHMLQGTSTESPAADEYQGDF